MQYIQRYIFDIYLYLPSYLSAQKKLLMDSFLLKIFLWPDLNTPGFPLVLFVKIPVKAFERAFHTEANTVPVREL